MRKASRSRRPSTALKNLSRPWVELLEDRTVPSTVKAQAHTTYVLATHTGPDGRAVPDQSATPPSTALTPAQFTRAYGIDQIRDGGVLQQGANQTIAIIDAYDDPALVSSSDPNFLNSDLHKFDVQFGLPDPMFTKVAQDGSTNYPAPGGGSGWSVEESLDVEWAHAVAPKANIILIEANSGSLPDLLSAGATYAAQKSGAQVVTMSFGFPGYFDFYYDYAQYDSVFASPSSHGVTFLASSGDGGYDTYPSESPSVVSVGGTSLFPTYDGYYSSESGWNGSGGGASGFEPTPAFQTSPTNLGYSSRATPDVALDADPNTGVAIYDSYDFGSATPWEQIGGTSLSSPAFAGIVAITNEVRANHGKGSLDGNSQTLPALYDIYGNATQYANDFHDITTGSSFNQIIGTTASAGPGYDLVTGIGTPVANRLVPDLAGVPADLMVTGGTPAPGSRVTTPPTTFTVTFSSAVEPNSLAASSFKVNGISASAVSLDPTDTTATFTYASSPVTTEGLQTISLPAGSALRQSDSAPSDPYSVTFRYDSLTLAVAYTNPPTGSVLTVPPTSFQYAVTFNRPIDPATASPSNLEVSMGTVTGATVLPGNRTVQYTITGLTEGPLQVAIPPLQVLDANDNPYFTPFSAAYTLHYVNEPYPALTPALPLGSLIYQGNKSGLILGPGLTDSFVLPVNRGQQITVAVTSTASLQPTVKLYDPSGALLGSNTAPGAGQTALLQMVATTTGGPYTIAVSGASGTTGGYTVQVTLNATLDANASVAPQNINGAFVNLTTSLTSAQRAAVLGTTTDYSYNPTVLTPTFTDISTTGTPTLQGDFSYFDGSTATLTPTDLSGFTFSMYGQTYSSLSFSTDGLITFGGPNSAPAFATISNGGFGSEPPQAAIAPYWGYYALETYGTSGQPEGVYWQVVGSGASQHLIIQWNVEDFASGDSPPPVVSFEAVLNANGSIQFNYGNLTGGSFEDNGAAEIVGVKGPGKNAANTIFDDFSGANQYVGPNQSTLLTPVAPVPDFYSFTLQKGDTVSLAATPLAGRAVTVQLLNSGMGLLATGGGGATNLGSYFTNFSVSATGTYYAEITGPGAAYSLVVVGNAAFQTTPNSTQAQAQDLTGGHGVLGYLQSVTTLTVSDSGWYNSTGLNSPSNKNYIVAVEGGIQYNDFFVFNLSGVSEPILAAQLNAFNPNSPGNGYQSPNASDTYSLYDVSTPISQLQAGGSGQVAIYNDLGTGVNYGNTTVSNASNGTIVTTSLNAAGVSALNGAEGSQFAVGGTLSTAIPGYTGNQYLFGYTGFYVSGAYGQPPPTLSLTQNTSDWYKVTLSGNQNALEVETSTPGAGPGEFMNVLDPHIQLYNASGTLLATGGKLADGNNESLFAAGLTGGGTYYIKVTSPNTTSGEYFLSATPLIAGVNPVGNSLYVAGTTGSNDQVQIDPAGSSNTGSTGVKVTTQLNGVNTQMTYTQSFAAIYVVLQGGNENVHEAGSLMTNTVVSAGNGNDNVTLAGGNDTVTLGNGNDNVQVAQGNNKVTVGSGTDVIQAGDGNNVVVAYTRAGHTQITLGDGNNSVTTADTSTGQVNVQVGGGNNSVTVGDGNDSIKAGNGSNAVFAGDGNDSIKAGNGGNAVFAGDGNDNVQAGNGTDSVQLGNGSDSVQFGNGSDSATVGNGTDNVQLGNGSNTLTLGSGNDIVRAGNGANSVTAGNGSDNVNLGNGANTVTLGNGNDIVNLGNGNNVVVTGNGDDNITAGNGDNLIAAGLGQHTVQVGNGSNILIDGSVTVTQAGDSLRQILNDWILNGASAANVASIRSRMGVTYNTTYANTITAGGGLDWFWYTYPQDKVNKKAGDLLN